MNNVIDKIKKSSIHFQVFQLLTERLGIKFTPIRLKPFSKAPQDPGWTDPSYDPNLISWARHPGNVGIVPGRSDLLVIDCDTGESIKFFIELANRIGLPTETLVVKTRRGAHYYYYCTFSNELEKRQFAKGDIKIDILAGNKCQVVAPYSILKVNEEGQILDANAKEYFLFVYEPLYIPEKLVEINRDTYNQLIAELQKEIKPIPQTTTQTTTQTQKESIEKELSNEEIEKLAQVLSEYFVEGQRQNVLLYTVGYLRKELNVSEESIYRLYENLQSIDDTKDLKARLGAIKKTFEKDIANIAGKTGLVEVLGEETARKLCYEIKQALGIQTQKHKKDEEFLEEPVQDPFQAVQEPFQELFEEEPFQEDEDEEDEDEPEDEDEEFKELLQYLPHPPREERKGKESLSMKIRRVLEHKKSDFWLSTYGEAYFSLGPNKHLKVDSNDFKDLLQDLACHAFQKTLHHSTMEEVLSFCRFWARKNSPLKLKVFSRVGYSFEENFIEVNVLHDKKVLRITPDSLELASPRLKLVYSKSQLPLFFDYDVLKSMYGKKFEADEVFQLFSQVFNLQTKEELALLIAWMIKTFYPVGEYPVLAILGEREGVGKSTFSKFVNQLLDRSVTPLKTFPRNRDDLFVLAKENFILTFDNLSYIDEDISDALCQLSTGGSLSKRKLYTDSTAIDIPIKRPIVINSIFNVLQKRDLRRRCIILELKKPVEFKPQRKLEEDFKKIAPTLYAYLILCVQEALKEKVIDLNFLDLADFCEWVAKAHPVFYMEGKEFIQTLQANREGIAQEILESNLLLPIIEEKLNVLGLWETTAKELFKLLKERYPNEKNLPSSPERVGRELKKIASDLESIGIKVEFIKTKRKRLILFSKELKSS